MWTLAAVAICFVIALVFFLYELLRLIKQFKKPNLYAPEYRRGTREDVEFELQEIKARLSEIQESIKAQREGIRKVSRKVGRKNG